MAIALPDDDIVDTKLQCTTTSIEVHETTGVLPTQANRGYLFPKVEFSLLFPNLAIRTKNGTVCQLKLKQHVLSGIIRIEEMLHRYQWLYKAEVCFDMTVEPPIPYLVSGSEINRRHACRPTGKRPDKIEQAEDSGPTYRCPDIIIVKDEMTRWPSLAGSDHRGDLHPDNLMRLIEVKFPGDTFSRDQERAYLKIVRLNRQLFVLLTVLDCRGKEEQEALDERVIELNQLPRKKKYSNWEDVKDEWLLPLYSRTPLLTEPFARMQPWLVETQENASNLLDGVFQSVEEVGQDCLTALRTGAGWLFEAHEWVYHQAQRAWQYGTHLYPIEKLRQAWQEISAQTDITLERLKDVKWAHVAYWGLGVVGVALVFAFGGEIVTLVAALLPEFLVILRLLCQFGRLFAEQLIKTLPADMAQGSATLGFTG